jgi:anti-anti-sigma factor
VAPALDVAGEVILDLAGLTFIDSFGMRTIALLAQMVGDRGLVLRSPRREVVRVLELTDIGSVPGIRVERA